MSGILATIISPLIALCTGITMWMFNESGKRKYSIYMRKSELYEKLIGSINGFYSGSESDEKKQAFLDNLSLAQIYASAEVIDKGYAFLMKLHTEKKVSDEEKQNSLNELVVAIREDMGLKEPKTKLMSLSVARKIAGKMNIRKTSN